MSQTTKRNRPVQSQAKPKQTGFSVILTATGPNKINVIQAVREVTGLGLKEAKDLVDNAPKPIKGGLRSDQAEAIRAKFTEQGATVEIEASNEGTKPETGNAAIPLKGGQAAIAPCSESAPSRARLLREIPNWVGQIIPDHTYHLSCFVSGDDNVELLDVSRGEYIALKAHLAAMRGYTPTDSTSAIVRALHNKPIDLKQNLFFAEDVNVADHLLMARGVYRQCPDAVVTTNEAFEDELRNIYGDGE